MPTSPVFHHSPLLRGCALAAPLLEILFLQILSSQLSLLIPQPLPIGFTSEIIVFIKKKKFVHYLCIRKFRK